MAIFGVLITAIISGVGGAFTPCALGVNMVFLGYVTGKPRLRRLWDWTLFTLGRAVFLTLVGFAFGWLGTAVGDFTWIFQIVVNVLLIAMGGLFILGAFRPLPFLAMNFAGDAGARMLNNKPGILGLGALFGLDITACLAPLILAILAQTILAGNWLVGGAALFLFGVGLNLPVLAVTMVDGADHWLLEVSRRYRMAFYLLVGGVLIVLGLAELALSFV